MKVDVLGLGESIEQFKPSSNITIGVNDIWKHFPVDYLVLVDRPNRFNTERLNQIIDSTPMKFYSHIDEWKDLVPNFNKINLAGPRGKIDNIESDDICYSNNSTFVAVVIAYKLGAKEINIFGADFNNHPNFNNRSIEVAINDFKGLFDYLKLKGIKINISKGSRLNEIYS